MCESEPRCVLVAVSLWGVTGMAGWFRGDFRGWKWIALETCLDQIFPASLWEKEFPSEGESWSKGGSSFSPCVTLTSHLSLEKEPAGDLTAILNLLLTHLCVPLSSSVEWGQRLKAYTWASLSQTPSAVASTERGKKSSLQKGLFLLVACLPFWDHLEWGDLGLPRSSTPVWLHRIRICVFLCIGQTVNQDTVRQQGKVLGLNRKRSKAASPFNSISIKFFENMWQGVRISKRKI